MNDRQFRTSLNRWLTGTLFAIAAGCAVIAVLTLIEGPLRWQLPGSTFTNQSPIRPAVVAGIAGIAGMLLYGWRDWIARVRRIEPFTWAVVLSVLTFAAGLNYTVATAGGADASGYITQADRWLAGELTTDQSWAADAPWPTARWTFSPLGTRPSQLEPWLLSPGYPPGLPLMLAAGKFIGGQEGLMWVVPLTGAVLVLTTFGIGRRLASPGAGLIGAWLMATSPAFLFMQFNVMSDVPAAAACAVSFYYLLDRRPGRALAAGLASGLAIALRPNLALCVVIFGLWYLVPVLRAGTTDRRNAFVQGVIFSMGLMAGAAVVGAVHQVLNGSPFISTYGSMSGAFSIDHFRPNLALYSQWIVQTHTPVIVAGFAVLVIPARRLWPACSERLIFFVGSVFVLVTWLMYCLYLVFDAWWYLRFLLPTFPFLMVGTGAVVAAVVARAGRAGAAVATAGVLALGVYQTSIAVDRHAFDQWRGERRYATVAREVRSITDRNTAVFSFQHSSSIRYYGGRVSIRYDLMDATWIDRSVDWLAERGIHSYLLVDDWEIPELTKQFPGRRILGRIEAPPVLHYIGASQVYLYDLTAQKDASRPPMVFTDRFRGARSLEPVAMPSLNFDPAR